jgi:hypothetical protein
VVNDEPSVVTVLPVESTVVSMCLTPTLPTTYSNSKLACAYIAWVSSEILKKAEDDGDKDDKSGAISADSNVSNTKSGLLNAKC